MVSRQRAREAVLAGPPIKRSRLMLLLGKTSDQELATWGIQDEADNKAILGFILARAREAAARAVAAGGGGGGGEAVAAPGPKTVTFLVTVVVGCETKYVDKVITLNDEAAYKDLMSKEYAVGVVGVGNTGGAERIIVNFADLEDGQYYKFERFGDNRSPAALRTELNYLGAGREAELTQAVCQHARQTDATCHVDSSLGALEGATGTHEQELDGAVICEDKGFAMSHKTRFEGPGMTKDAADRARKVATKSNDPAYSDTKFAAFKGKDITAVFMAEYVPPGLEEALHASCKEYDVQPYKRTGSAISPWASSSPGVQQQQQPAPHSDTCPGPGLPSAGLGDVAGRWGEAGQGQEAGEAGSEAGWGGEAGEGGKAGRLPPLGALCHQRGQPYTTSTTSTLHSRAFGSGAGGYGARTPRPLLAPRRVGAGAGAGAGGSRPVRRFLRGVLM